MAREEERKFNAVRRRVVLGISTFVYLGTFLMYFVVQPFMTAYGRRLELPDGRMVLMVLAMAATGLALIPGSALVNILSGIKITLGDPKGGGPDAPS